MSYEPIINVYQTLVAYNGSSTTTFVPQLATCVPGTAACTALYGSDLITNNASTGLPQYFTFVLDSSARFYDPSTGASWGVYPSDVMFSMARTMSFAEQPGVGSQPGWIQTQALLQYGGYGIHQPWNNTPAPVLQSMLVNDSAFCPAAAMTSGNGCITFNAVGSGSDWPFFLQLVADPLGASVEPCGWYTYVGAGLPGFTGTSAANGDGPCLLPGGAHSTSDASFQHFVSTVAPSSWDAVQLAAAANPNNPQPAVQWSMVGSGPYYALTVSKAIGYVLKANPAYRAPTGCAGSPGCEPLPGTYQGTINVYWEQDDTTGIAEYQAGQADLAGIQLPAHVSTLKTLLSAGKIDLTYIPTISIFFQTFNFDMNISGQNQIPGNTGTTNVPADFYSSLGMRELFITSYPYVTINSTLLQAGNISTGFDYGGAIPKYLGDYYSYNVTWPYGQPDTNPNDVGGAAWWWAQLNDPTSQWYDAALANYSASSPAVFPIVGETGSTFYDAAIADLIGWIVNITHGVFQPYTFDITFHDLVHYFFSAGPGQNVLPLANLGWAPDYPDPTDYTVPMYYPDSTYTYGDAVAEQLALPQYNQPSCPYASNYSDPSSAWAALVYYHGLSQVPDACQGIAYSIMLYWQEGAAPLAVGPQRTLDFQMANQLGYLLALYIYNFQSIEPTTYAPWINPDTINTNVMVGGGGDFTWYTLGYTSSVNTVTFTQSGLPSGTSWSVSVGGTTLTSTGTSVSGSIAAAVYNYTVAFAPGFTVSPAVGSVDLTSGAQTVALTFTGIQGPTVPLTFSAAGLVTGNGWSVLLTTSGGVHAPAAGASGLGLVVTQSQSVTIRAPAQTSYDFAVSGANGYTSTGGTGTISTGTSGASHTTTFTPVNFNTYGITITASGLIPGAQWTATVNGVSQRATTASMTFYQQDGSYGYTIGASGWSATPSTGTFVVNGSGHSQGDIVVTQAVNFVFVAYTITYNQAGLPPAGSGTWAVAVNGVSQTGTGGTTVLVFTFTNATSIYSNFTYVVTAPSGYSVSPSAGTLSFGTGSQVVNLTFASTSGTLTLTGLPSGASCWIAGLPVTESAAGTCTSGLLTAGTISYEVQASGYYTYFNNATVGGGQSASVPVSMTQVPSSTSTSWTSLSTLAYIIIAVLAVLVVVFIVTTVMARGKPPMGQPPESWKGSESTPSEQPPK